MDIQSPVIDVHHLRKSYGEKIAVYDFSMTAKSGEIIGFLGPNGSGKTTVIKMLCGLLAPDKGNGTCLGYDILTQSNLIRSQVGYMTQSFSLYPYLSIYENLRFIALAFKVKNSDQRINEIVDSLGLRQRMHQLAGGLSGGWKQRLALGAALIHHPRLLLLDEPTAGVDPEARRDFWETIGDIAASGVTILVSTHYMDEAERCHRILYLAYGNLVAQGSIQEVISGAKLSTWLVSGENVHSLEKELITLKGVDQVTAFGVNLHVIGKDRKLLLDSLRPYLGNLKYRWRGIDPSLEDVFIYLVAAVKEDRFD